jgi:hypothetical protein
LGLDTCLNLDGSTRPCTRPSGPSAPEPTEPDLCFFDCDGIPRVGPVYTVQDWLALRWNWLVTHGVFSQNPPAANNVTPIFIKTFPCTQSATGLISTLESRFSDFANYVGSTYAVFPPGPVSLGETLNINAGLNFGGTAETTHNWQVVVSATAPNFFTFATVAGQHAFAGGSTVTFSAYDAGNGNVQFSVNVNARYANLAYWVGGKLLGGEHFEANTWNNLVSNVASFCHP